MPATSSAPSSLRSVLLRNTQVTEAQWDAAETHVHETGQTSLDWLISEGQLTDEEAVTALGEYLALPVRTSIKVEDIDNALTKQVPITFAKTHHLIPLQRFEEGRLIVAVADPYDTTPLDDLRLLFFPNLM